MKGENKSHSIKNIHDSQTKKNTTRILEGVVGLAIAPQNYPKKKKKGVVNRHLYENKTVLG